jgi:low temperature requirement protein LtrA
MHSTAVPPAPDRNLLRQRHGSQHHRVEFVELFFDLVFVFAVTQVSHALMAHFSWRGVLEAGLLTLSVWWVWIYTAWATNWLDPAKVPVRLLLLLLMAPGLILSASIPAAFESRGIGFAGAYAFMQLVRTYFFLWAVRGHPVLVRSFQRIAAWLTLSSVFWLIGARLEGDARLATWAFALALEIVSPALGYWTPGIGRSTTTDWDVEGGHFAERCGLFVIIALGESLLVTGATFAGLVWDAATMAAFAASLVGSAAMWWLYFDTTAEIGSRVIARSADPGRLARLAYTYIHLLLVAGIIVAAVADEFVLAHPSGHSEPRVVIAVVGSTALFLAGLWLFRLATVSRSSVSLPMGLIVLGALAAWGSHLAPWILMAAAAAILVSAAVWEAWRGRTPAIAASADASHA